MNSKIILLVVNNLSFFLSHRLEISLSALKHGYVVHVAYGELGGANESALVQLGLKLHFLPMQRGQMNPIADLRCIHALWKLFRIIRPNLVHLVTIKPVLYGGIAARLAKVPAVVTAIAGLGSMFGIQSGWRAVLLHFLVRPLFEFSLKHPNQLVIFQNTNDLEYLKSMNQLLSDKMMLIRGSGVDLKICPLIPEPIGIPVVTMASRLLHEKGVREFIQAARLLKTRNVPAKFWLVGEPDFANPFSVTAQELETWKSEGIVEFLGFRRDVPLLYSQSNIVTLPSYYGEGLPKSLIEAAACGRAVVTTDMPGCRDAIEHNVTGLLVPPRDPEALAVALEKLISDTSTRNTMGKAGRTLAERDFRIEIVVDLHMQIYNKLI